MHIVGGRDSLFYTPVKIGDTVTLDAMLDSGSMACTINESAEMKLRSAGAVDESSEFKTDVTLVGCGGLRVKPKSSFNLTMEVYGMKMAVPTLVVPGQHDELIIGTNVIKHILRYFKLCDGFWQALSSPTSADPECESFLSMLAGLDRWRGEEIPGKIGTVRCNSAVYLEPGCEYLVWGKLSKSAVVSPGSAVMTEPTSSHSAPRGVMVARLIISMWGDGWVPLKLINTSGSPVMLRRNAKIADLYPCLALEDIDDANAVDPFLINCHTRLSDDEAEVSPVSERLKSVGLDSLNIDSCDISDACKQRLLNLILSYEDIFSRGHLDCGEAKGFVHRIHLSDTRPFRLPFRRVAPGQYQKLRQVLTEMEEKEIIRRSTSEYASPLVLVWKKNGDLRVCTDFRWLNRRTLKDAHPLPHQADCLAALGGNALFSTMDLTSGFYNMPLHEEDRKFTAFTTPMGLFEYNRLPQGLCNSPGSFMRMMTNIFGDENFLSLLCYLDDLIVFGPDEKTAIDRLEMVFGRLRTHNLKLAPKKCHLMRKSVKFLGHMIDQTGVSTDPSKVESISKINSLDLMELDGTTPSQKKIRSFLGMVNYYQHFVPNYSAIAKPLFNLLKGQKTTARNLRKLGHACQNRKLKSSDWTQAQDQAVERLKASLVESVVLAHPDFDRPFILATDASLDGIGAVLSQVTEGETKARPVAFASKSLSRSQQNYPAHRLEFLALKWSVCDKFSHWLKGHEFTVLTDNNPLAHILTKPKLDCCEQRWVAKLASYNFDIKYVPGPQNIVADALSRVPFVKTDVTQRLLKEPYEALLAGSRGMSTDSVQDAFRRSCDSVRRLSVINLGQSYRPDIKQTKDLLTVSNADVSAILNSHVEWNIGARARAMSVVDHLPQLMSEGQDTLPTYSEQELREKQLSDKIVSRVLYYVERQRRPSRRERSKESTRVLRYLRHWEKLVVRSGILYRVSCDRLSRKKRYQFVVPESLVSVVLRGIHDDCGHQGQSRSLSLARQRFFWLNMDQNVRGYVRLCQRCTVSKTTDPSGRAPLENILTSRPLELVCIDFWSAEDSTNKSVDVLVITDHFTKLAQAFVCRDQSAKQVARIIWDRYFCIYGLPERIHSDQGPSFESKLIRELLRVSGVNKSRTTPYHPMGNGSVERFNRTLGNMIRALSPDVKRDWPRRLQTLTFLYNCTIHETTGYAPFYLMFGRVPRLPIDILFRSVLNDPDVTCCDKFVSTLVKDLKEALQIAQEHATKELKRHAELYNRRVKGLLIETGDQVLLANKTERGKKKVADRWESTVYTVVDRKPDTHTYRIRNPATGQEKVVHRNLLMLVNFLPVNVEHLQSDQLSGVSTSCKRSSSVLSLCAVEDESLGGDAVVSEHTKDSYSSVTMDDSVMMKGKVIASCDDADVNCEDDSMSVQESDTRNRTISWVSELPERSHHETDQTPSGVLVDPVAEAFLSAPKSHVSDMSRDAITSVSDEDRSGGSISHESDSETVLSAQPPSQTPSNTHVADTESVPQSSSSITQVRTRFGRVVRPVERLIHVMSTQAVVQDTKHNVQAVCKSLFRAFSA